MGSMSCWSGLAARFFTATCEKIPTSPLLALPDMETRQIPVLEYRDHNYYEFTQYSRFAVKMRLNGHFSPIREKHGGSNRYVWFCHTFDLLVPTELYADTHPEYYALIGGVRKTQKHCTQLCLTNPDVLEISIASVREALKANPEARIISITQNDWGESCQCDACRAADEEEHSPSGHAAAFCQRYRAAPGPRIPRRSFRHVRLYVHPGRFPLSPSPRLTYAYGSVRLKPAFRIPLRPVTPPAASGAPTALSPRSYRI